MTRYERAKRPTMEEWWTYDIKPPPRWPAAVIALSLVGVATACAVLG